MTQSCLPDIDECAEDSNLCGPGTCSNIPNGGFYSCDCSVSGYESNSLSASTGDLDCIGMNIHLFTQSLEA